MSKDTAIKTYSFNPLPLEIEVKDLAFIKEVPHLLGQPHRAQFYQVLWVKEGVFSARVDFNEIQIHADEMLIISAGQVCEFNMEQTYKGQLILFTDSFFNRTTEDAHFLFSAAILSPGISSKKVPLRTCFAASVLTLLALELQKEPDDFQGAIAQNYLRIILFEAERQFKKTYSPINQGIVQRFYHAVESNYTQQKSTQYYADLLGVTEKVLTKELKIVTGKTPKLYIDARVILEAKRLLSYSKESSKTIAFLLGFDEPSNFSKYFRKHVKVTPQAFRETVKREGLNVGVGR